MLGKSLPSSKLGSNNKAHPKNLDVNSFKGRGGKVFPLVPLLKEDPLVSQKPTNPEGAPNHFET